MGRTERGRSIEGREKLEEEGRYREGERRREDLGDGEREEREQGGNRIKNRYERRERIGSSGRETGALKSDK